MMNIIDFVKEFEFKKRRRLRSWRGCENMLRGVRIYAQGGAAGPRRPPETAPVHRIRQIYRKWDECSSGHRVASAQRFFCPFI